MTFLGPLNLPSNFTQPLPYNPRSCCISIRRNDEKSPFPTSPRIAPLHHARSSPEYARGVFWSLIKQPATTPHSLDPPGPGLTAVLVSRRWLWKVMELM